MDVILKEYKNDYEAIKTLMRKNIRQNNIEYLREIEPVANDFPFVGDEEFLNLCILMRGILYNVVTVPVCLYIKNKYQFFCCPYILRNNILQLKIFHIVAVYVYTFDAQNKYQTAVEIKNIVEGLGKDKFVPTSFDMILSRIEYLLENKKIEFQKTLGEYYKFDFFGCQTYDNHIVDISNYDPNFVGGYIVVQDNFKGIDRSSIYNYPTLRDANNFLLFKWELGKDISIENIEHKTAN